MGHKKIISGQTYDTDTATRLYYREGNDGDRYQGLYQTPEGAFFFWEYDTGVWGKIEPKTDEEAYEWLKEHADEYAHDLLEQYFLEGRGKRRVSVQLPAHLVLRLEALAAKKSLSLKSYLMRSLEERASAELEARETRRVRTRPKWLWFPDPFLVAFGDGDERAADVPEILREIMDEVYRALHYKLRRLAAMGARAALDHVLTDKVGDVGGFEVKLDKMERDGHLTESQRHDLDTILAAGHAAAHRGWAPTDEQINTVLEITESLIESTYIHKKRAERLARDVPRRPPRAKKT